VPDPDAGEPDADASEPDPDAALVSLDDVRQAARRIAGVASRTPLLPIAGDAWLKAECLQPIGSFKIRGAYNAVAQLDAAERAAGVVTHSSGNHAQGVARAARLLGMRAVVVMPRDASAVKVAAVRADGAEIDLVGPADEERVARADELARRDGLALIPSYDDRRIVAGQGTLGLEVLEQLAESGVDPSAPLTVLVEIGGGGLASGVCVAIKGLRPDAWVIGVEPELAADARESLREHRIVRWGPELTGRTSADGMRSTALGRVTFAHLDRLLDGVVAVSEEEIARAMLHAATAARLVVEPSGATALAAWLFHRAELPSGRVTAIVVSGGNVDPTRYRELLAMGEAAARRA
jgi:threonine dehydratase